MSTENTNVEPVEQNLDDFAAELFGRKEAAPVETTTEVVDEDEPESDASTEDTHVDADDTSAPDNDDDSSEEQDSNKEDAPKPKKNRFQERIDELIKEREDEKRERVSLQKRLEELEKNTKTEPPKVEKPQDGAPKPTDLNEDGSEKYPLGEFDPQFMRDTIKHTLDEERRVRDEQEKKTEAQRQLEAAQAELQNEWNDKLVGARERYPDFQEKGEQMLTVFENIDQAYGEYLTNTIMDMEFGPDVFYYLSNNIDEAKKIVDGGPKKATIALGRLEAKFAFADEEKETKRPKVSNAPPPPPVNKGSDVAKPSIRGDEKDVDLDDFAAALFKKKRRS